MYEVKHGPKVRRFIVEVVPSMGGMYVTEVIGHVVTTGYGPAAPEEFEFYVDAGHGRLIICEREVDMKYVHETRELAIEAARAEGRALVEECKRQVTLLQRTLAEAEESLAGEVTVSALGED